MKKCNLYLILSFILFGLMSCTTPPPQISQSDSIRREIHDDAEILSFQIANSVLPDPAVIANIKKMLVSARQYNPDIREIHVRLPWNPKMLQVGIRRDTLAFDSKDPLNTGNDALNLLNRRYPPRLIESAGGDDYRFHYERALNVPALAGQLHALPGIAYAKADSTAGDGDNIWIEWQPEQWKIVFVRGWGDCVTQCSQRHFWEFKFNEALNIIGMRETGDPLPEPKK